MRPLRVVSWNVRSLRDGSRAVAALLARLQPDVIVLQEAPRLAGFRTSRSLLARRTGLRLVTRDRAAGNLLLAGHDVRVLSGRAVALPRRPGLHRRAVALAAIEVRGARLHVAGTHLDLDPAARLDSAARIRALLPPGPLVLGADVNEEPDGPAWDVLARGLTAVAPAPTFPAARPRRTFDVVLSTLPVLTAEVLDVDGASDHRALLVELDLC